MRRRRPPWAALLAGLVGEAGRWVWVDGHWVDADGNCKPRSVTEVTSAHAPETTESHDE